MYINAFESLIQPCILPDLRVRYVQDNVSDPIILRSSLLMHPVMSENETSSDSSEDPHTRRAYEFIREKILNGFYASGYRLKTATLAKEGGVSRTPVREALRQLQSEGLVDMRPRLGASVREVSFLEFKEMCELRLALESFSAEQAARNRGPEEIIELEEAYDQMKALMADLELSPNSEEIIQKLIQQDIRFHLSVLQAAGNGLLRTEVFRLHLFSRLVPMNLGVITRKIEEELSNTPERRRWVLECHHKILLGIRNGDPAAARAAMHEHISDIIERGVLAMARAQKRSQQQAMPQAKTFYAVN